MRDRASDDLRKMRDICIMPPMTVPGTAIAAARVLAGLTQTDLAQRAHLGRRTIVEIEAGRPVASESKEAAVQALADLGVTIEVVGGRTTVSREH